MPGKPNAIGRKPTPRPRNPLAAKASSGSKSNPRYANGTARRKLRLRVLAEEDACWICGQPVDKRLPAGLPGSPEVDEIVPVSRGGSPYDRANVRLAHRICNQRRGNRMVAQVTPSMAFCPTTVDW